MDLRQQFVRRRRDDRASLDTLPVPTGPSLPEAGEGERPPVLELEIIGPLGSPLLIPFEEAVGDHKTRPALERLSEGGLLGERLAPRVDQLIRDAGVFGPARDESPIQIYKFSAFSARVSANGGDRLRRRDVEARRKLVIYLYIELFCDNFLWRLQTESSAHTKSPLPFSV